MDGPFGPLLLIPSERRMSRPGFGLTGLLVEYLAWTAGLGAVILNQFGGPVFQPAGGPVGGTPAEVAEMVFLAATDPELNQRIRKGGRATYKQYFTPLEVAKTLSDELVRARNA